MSEIFNATLNYSRHLFIWGDVSDGNKEATSRGGGMCKPGVAVATPELLPGSVILAIFGNFLPISRPLKQIFATPKQIFVFRYP